ncbi:hypothetical protein O181_071231 [Austropuccinia psidii MF-1]|uniref:Uncharacterized protein n=1 Tax=Austropuccinia psidii MF-1 TaxID=1389203 RepID=A0A9Q3F6W6_9BASI|nr:hypothetical protein [Austropuccinia psidii MF-1]
MGLHYHLVEQRKPWGKNEIGVHPQAPRPSHLQPISPTPMQRKGSGFLNWEVSPKSNGTTVLTQSVERLQFTPSRTRSGVSWETTEEEEYFSEKKTAHKVPKQLENQNKTNNKNNLGQ